MRGQSARETFLGQQHWGRGVGQHERQPFRRVVRVERDIRAAGLQHAQHADDHFRRTLQAQRHERFGADAVFAEVVGELVRATVELPVGQRFAFENQRRSVGRALQPARRIRPTSVPSAG